MVQKACRACRTIFEGKECPACGSKETIEGFKGKISVLNADQSELASKLGLKKAGVFAIRFK